MIKMSFLSKPPLYNVFTSWKADNKCLVIDMSKYYPSMCSVYKAGTHDTKIKKQNATVSWHTSETSPTFNLLLFMSVAFLWKKKLILQTSRHGCFLMIAAKSNEKLKMCDWKRCLCIKLESLWGYRTPGVGGEGLREGRKRRGELQLVNSHSSLPSLDKSHNTRRLTRKDLGWCKLRYSNSKQFPAEAVGACPETLLCLYPSVFLPPEPNVLPSIPQSSLTGSRGNLCVLINWLTKFICSQSLKGVRFWGRGLTAEVFINHAWVTSDNNKRHAYNRGLHYIKTH